MCSSPGASSCTTTSPSGRSATDWQRTTPMPAEPSRGFATSGQRHEAASASTSATVPCRTVGNPAAVSQACVRDLSRPIATVPGSEIETVAPIAANRSRAAASSGSSPSCVGTTSRIASRSHSSSSASTKPGSDCGGTSDAAVGEVERRAVAGGVGGDDRPLQSELRERPAEDRHQRPAAAGAGDEDAERRHVGDLRPGAPGHPAARGPYANARGSSRVARSAPDRCALSSGV